MKKFRKTLACVLSIVTMSSIALAPIESNAYSPSCCPTCEARESAVTEAIIILEDADEFSGAYYVCGTSEYATIDIEQLGDYKYGWPVKIDDTIDVSTVETIVTMSCGHELYVDAGDWYLLIGCLVKRDVTIMVIPPSEETKLGLVGEDDEGYQPGVYETLDDYLEWYSVDLWMPKIDCCLSHDSDSDCCSCCNTDNDDDNLNDFSIVGDGDTNDNITIGDSGDGNDNSGSGIGESTVTCIQGDVNLDGVVNGLDLVLLKKYILGIV